MSSPAFHPPPGYVAAAPPAPPKSFTVLSTIAASLAGIGAAAAILSLALHAAGDYASIGTIAAVLGVVALVCAAIAKRKHPRDALTATALIMAIVVVVVGGPITWWRMTRPVTYTIQFTASAPSGTWIASFGARIGGVQLISDQDEFTGTWSKTITTDSIDGIWVLANPASVATVLIWSADTHLQPQPNDGFTCSVTADGGSAWWPKREFTKTGSDSCSVFWRG